MAKKKKKKQEKVTNKKCNQCVTIDRDPETKEEKKRKAIYKKLRSTNYAN